MEFGEILVGKNSQYNEQPPKSGMFRQDLSGAARNRRAIIFADDGGSPSAFNFIRVTRGLPDDFARNLPLQKNHKDLEGATFHRGWFVITTSLSNAEDPDQRRLTRFKLNHEGDGLAREKSVDLRDQLMEALRDEFGDEWFSRIKSEPAKSGGLNIEAISRPHTKQRKLLWGLRSPLFGDTFGNPETDPELSLSEGLAIVAFVHWPFSHYPAFGFRTLDLHTEFGNHGIRAMEWIPALGGYVLIGGPIPAANDYSLWLWRPHRHWRYGNSKRLQRLQLPEFDALCRPESVIQLNEDGKRYLTILSEESGNPCRKAEFTFVMAEIPWW